MAIEGYSLPAGGCMLNASGSKETAGKLACNEEHVMAAYAFAVPILPGQEEADRRFIAPLEARCQDDYNRQIDVLLGPLFQSGAQRRIELPERTDA